MSTNEWSGRRVQQARAIVETWLPAPCGRCGEEVDGTSEEWNVGHIRSRAAYPELTWVVSNWRAEHRRCSDGTGPVASLEKALRGLHSASALDDRGRAALADLEEALFPIGEVGGQASLPPSLSPNHKASKVQPIEPRPELAWSQETLLRYDWLTEFAEVPDDASPPLWMSPPPEDAVCSYASPLCSHHPDMGLERPGGIAWIEQAEGKTLRWWQRLAITRQLEHRDDSSLCHREILESAPRRAGKSVRMRGVALWRMVVGPQLFDEDQTVMHTGSDIPICREIQRGAWRWATGQWGPKSITTANGKECIESGDGRHRWMVKSQDGVYGYDVTLGLGDECWNVKPDTISEGLEPATLERISPQVHLTSTAHRRATSLMRGKLSTALTEDDPETLVIVWAAPAGSDPSDPAVWRAASPHWTEDRRKMIAAKYLKAKAGEVDPQADDPDPMAGFTAQYLNIWRLVGRAEPKGVPFTTEEAWQDRIALPDDRTPDAAAIEAWFSAGVSLALAWREGDAATVSVTGHRDLAEAVAALRRSGYRGKVGVDGKLAADPALAKVRKTPVKTTASAAAAELDRLSGEGALYHDGGSHLTGQVLDLRTQPGTDGPRVVSRERCDAVKAAAGAVAAARTKSRLGKPRIITAAN